MPKMTDGEDQLELETPEEDIEMVMKKLKEANAKLKNIQKQCSESIIQTCNLKSELELLHAKELTLKKDVSEKIEKEKIIQTECEQKAQQLRKLSWQRKIIAVKLKLETTHRQHYENIMKEGIAPVNFLKSNGDEKQLQKTKDLKNQLDELKGEIAEKQKLGDECEKSHAEAQKSIKKHMEMIREIKKNIENLEILINQQEEELRRLSGNTDLTDINL